MDKKTKVVVSALICLKDNVLLLRRAKNFEGLAFGKGIWDLPGGKVEFGFGLEEALQKELNEETAMSLEQQSRISLENAFAYLISDSLNSVHRINLFYKLVLSETPSIQLSEEHDAYFFASMEDMESLNMIEPVRSFLLRYLQS